MGKNLQLSLKAKWFEMTKAGIKTEDYRELNEYWGKRLLIQPKDIDWSTPSDINQQIYDNWVNGTNNPVFKPFTHNIMTWAYPKSGDTDQILK